MTSRDPSVLVIRVLAGLHGLPALAAILYGGFVAAYDVLDGDSGDWDGFGTFIGSAMVFGGAVPLLFAVAAVRSSDPRVVRVCGLVLCGLALVLARWGDYVPPLWLLPSVALGAVSIVSMLTSSRPYDEPARPIRLRQDR